VGIRAGYEAGLLHRHEQTSTSKRESDQKNCERQSANTAAPPFILSLFARKGPQRPDLLRAPGGLGGPLCGVRSFRAAG